MWGVQITKYLSVVCCAPLLKILVWAKKLFEAIVETVMQDTVSVNATLGQCTILTDNEF